MSKKVLVIAVLVLLLLAGGWYYMSSKKGSTLPLAQNQTGSESSKLTNLKDLFMKGAAQTCTFTSENTKGTVYMDGKKMRQDYEVVTEKETMKSHMILTDNTIYSWVEGQKTGIKMSYDPNTTPQPTSTAESMPAGQSGSFNDEVDMDYKCSAGVSDAGKFTLPKDVTFSSFEIPDTSSATNKSSSSSQCSYCNNLTGDDKVSCLKALNCN